MKKALMLLLMVWSTLTFASGINFEIKFTPFVGNPATDDSVKTIAGKAQVFLNNVFISEQEIGSRELPVMFDEREIAPAIWLPVESLGTLLRKGKNTVRIEFMPNDDMVLYHTQLSWAEVNDQSTKTELADGFSASNQSGEGKEIKGAQGKAIVEKEFSADFATDQPWHHGPVVTALGEDDSRQLLKLINERVELFKPQFEGIYKILEMPHAGMQVDLAEIRKSGCLDKAYDAGVRIAARTIDDVEFELSGNQEVVIKGKAGMLYPLKPEDLANVRGEENQMCVGMVLFMAYPPQMIVIKNASGAWEVLY